MGMSEYSTPATVLVAILVLTSGIYFYDVYVGMPGNDDDVGIAVCIDCIPGSIGGGCTYVDDVTGDKVDPLGCFMFDSSREPVECSPDSRTADACIEIYQPVCGNDAREYPNSCFACMNENVIFYLEGECSDVVLVDSFESCAAAGNPVMESHPRQCRSADGTLFVEELA